ncbi:hypothetical protein PF002_g25893 [Phytophthora fragariae]|uniref:Uncharacterized protein n=1 Tax=Phytophthora fragariae TaxID=53985 RepID=A0A6A3WNC6_9STRA|nr:hypothetical protein PF002_g25893 [Phytophthora fragariae]
MVDMSGGEPPDPGQGPPVVVDGHLDGASAPGAPPGHQVAETPLVVPATAWAMPADASHRPDGPAPSSMAGAGRVWAGDAAAVLRSSPKLSEEQARASRVVAGVWNPLLQKRLINTMVKDWATLTDRTPRHGTDRCKATPGALHALQAKGTRIVNGVVPTFSPQARDSYKVKDVAELMALLAAHEAALVPHAEVVLDSVNGTSGVASEATPLRNVVAGTAASPAVVNTTGASTEVAEAAGDGYVVKLSERAKRAARKNNSTAAPVQQARQRSIPNHTTASTIAVAQEATDVRTPFVAPKARKKGRKQSGFAAFQRAEALGHYGVLAEDDSDGDDNTDVVTTSGVADVEMIDHDSTASIASPDVGEAVDVEMGDAPASAPPSEQTQPVLPAPLVSEPPAAPTVPVASCSKATTALVQTTLARYVNGTGLPTETNHPTQNERLGLPTLDSDGYDDEAELDHLIAQEEGLLQEAYGMDEFARGSQETGVLSDAEIEVPQRYPRLARGPITEDSYFRILRAAGLEDIPAEDRPHYSLLKQANLEAFNRWGALYRTQFSVPATRRRSSSHSISVWLLENPAVLRHLFAFLPFCVLAFSRGGSKTVAHC